MNFFIKILFFVSFSFGLFNYQDILNKSSLSYSGYSNIYAINRTSDSELIKLPFRLISIDFGYNYGDFSFNANWGLEHKIKTLDSAQPINSLIYDLISKTNVDYKSQFREAYFSFYPSFGEIKYGKQIHSWGAVDVGSPIDVLNSIDYYYLFTDSDETKIGKESLLIDLFYNSFKFEFIFMPKHIPNNLPNNDPDFPIVLPASVQDYQFITQDKKYEYGGYLQYSMSNSDWTVYYFSGYDRNFNLYGANVFSNESDILTVTDTVFSYRSTQMYALSNVSFIGDATLRADFAYFETDSGNQQISNRPYSGSDPISDFFEFNNNLASSYFNIAGKYYQYSLQLEYPLPYDIDFTTQIFGYEKNNIQGEIVDVELTNFSIYLDGKDFFYPGMGSSTATLAKNGVLFNLTKSLMDDTMEIQLSSLIDTEDKGSLSQLKWTYELFNNTNLSILYYKGKGNRTKFPDNPETVDIDESLLYPFNAMENFSHIRAQIQYYF